jgi:hypothetical protein
MTGIIGIMIGIEGMMRSMRIIVGMTGIIGIILGIERMMRSIGIIIGLTGIIGIILGKEGMMGKKDCCKKMLIMKKDSVIIKK